MRRLAGHLFMILCLLSLLMCVVSAVLWWRSFRGGDQIIWTRAQADAMWVWTNQGWVGGTPPPWPVVAAIEKMSAASWRGRIRLRRIGWIATDDRMQLPQIDQPIDAAESSLAPLTAQPPPGVTGEPGLQWARGDALRPSLMIGRRLEKFGGFARERGSGMYRVWLMHSASWMIYESAVEVPHWFVVAVTALLPAVVMMRWLRDRRRRSRAGLCPSCGYDLRATPQRCPECGAEAAAVNIT